MPGTHPSLQRNKLVPLKITAEFLLAFFFFCSHNTLSATNSSMIFAKNFITMPGIPMYLSLLNSVKCILLTYKDCFAFSLCIPWHKLFHHILHNLCLFIRVINNMEQWATYDSLPHSTLMSDH